MLANYHTHTFRCQHAGGEDREYVECAIKHGMKVLGMSDHCPWVYGDGYVSGIRMTPDQVDDYFYSFERLRREYADDITIYIGFEAEYVPELMEEQNKLLADYPVDYMILGQHFIGKESDGVYTGASDSSEERLRRYVDLIIAGVEEKGYSYVAHPDLINFSGAEEIYKVHMGRLCLFLKERGIPVEINMLGLIDGRNYPSERFLRIAGDIGNTAIIGCDAHSPESLIDTMHMDMCREYAKRCGLELVDYLPGLGVK